ncbi:MAG TPA: DNA-processing protein DprA, partial [Patescibacteria group bacterium]|nr:DNA-processing protein DprA [Patescibacteria group bacterium]
MQSNEYFLGFSVFSGIGPQTMKKLLKEFTSAENAWQQSPEVLENILGEKTANRFVVFRKQFSFSEYLEKLRSKSISFLTWEDKDYPSLLLESPHSPFVLYYKGDFSILHNTKSIGIVGTRKITAYGKQVTEMVTQELAKQNMVIVSGLALGVDAVAHKTALENYGSTIAVLGSGVDICTPSSHQKLYDEIKEKGVIVSQFPPGAASVKGFFPARNALIAGLSQAVLVTEAGVTSGALITAKRATELKRQVFCIPGPITSSLSLGITFLLKNGAFPVASGRDILDRLGIIEKTEKKESLVFDSFSPEEQEIIHLLE